MSKQGENLRQIDIHKYDAETVAFPKWYAAHYVGHVKHTLLLTMSARVYCNLSMNEFSLPSPEIV